MEFRELYEIKDLINSEGPILTLVDSFDEENPDDERLYLRGICLNGKANIYCKINDFELGLYFLGRLTLIELFLLRKDEDYVIEINGDQKIVFCDEDFEKDIINTIECGHDYYIKLSKHMRVENPDEEILHYIRRDYFNGVISLPAGKLTGSDWLRDYDINN